jgi:hypothetical protein
MLKKDSNQNNSPWLKSTRGRSFDNILLSFAFKLFYNNNKNNLSKPYSEKKKKKSEFIRKKPKKISTT